MASPDGEHCDQLGFSISRDPETGDDESAFEVHLGGSLRVTALTNADTPFDGGQQVWPQNIFDWQCNLETAVTIIQVRQRSVARGAIVEVATDVAFGGDEVFWRRTNTSWGPTLFGTTQAVPFPVACVNSKSDRFNTRRSRMRSVQGLPSWSQNGRQRLSQIRLRRSKVGRYPFRR